MNSKKKKIIGSIITGLTLILVIAGCLWIARLNIFRIYNELPRFTHEPGKILEMRVPMRDKVKLHTTVYQPEGKGPWPVVLIRSPYNALLFSSITTHVFVRYGYACVLQSTRGQNKSEGKWVPLENEFKDSEDAVKWLTKQNWQNGNIALYGPSYTAFTQWAAADRLPEQVKTMIPIFYGTDFYSSVYTRGMLHHEFFTAWAYLMPDRNIGADNGPLYQKALRYRPFIEADEKYLNKKITWFREVITNSAKSSAYWQRKEARYIKKMPGKVTIPVLMIGGWFDAFFKGQAADWQNLAVKNKSRYVIGPWTHAMRRYGDLSFASARGMKIQWNEIIEWLDHHLKDKKYNRKKGVVSAYIIGKDSWQEYKTWPPENTKKRFYLTAAKQKCPHGRLALKKNTAKQKFSFEYDPDNPVRTKGGSNMLAFILPGFSDVKPGPVFQNEPCTRKDILTFVSSPLSNTHIHGPVSVKLFVSSSAEDTSFSITLSIINEDGKAVNIRHSITRLVYRDNARTAKKYTAGSVVPVVIKTAPIAWSIQKGRKLRLDVSSSNFPLYHIHPNVKGPWVNVKDYKKAQQTLVLSKKNQSFVELPVMQK